MMMPYSSSPSVIILVFVFVLALIPISLIECAIGDLADIEIESSNVYENEWRSSVELVKDGSFRLSWKPSEHRIVFLVEVKSHGYFEVGFSFDGYSSKADIAIGWVNDVTKKPYLIDCHGDEGNRIPVKDTIQNFELLNGYQNSSHTVLVFTRLWNTCDKQHDITIGNDTIKLLWALNDGDDPTDDTLSNIVWHDKEKRGWRSLNLKNPSTKRPLKGTKHFDVRVPDVNLPHNGATAYWCKIYRQPPMSTKHHIIGYTPMLVEKNSELVRHMILYECHEKPTALLRMTQLSSEKGFLCYTPKMPVEAKSCTTPIITWAIGSEGEFFPKHVGLPIGEDSKQEKFYMLEVHYDNPQLKKVIDNSGLRLYYTEQLRKYDGGIFVTGTVISPLNIIPPYQQSYKMAGYCDKYCTKTVFPINGVNSVSVVLHSHSAARKMRLRHFRQGEELAPIVQDEHYDYDYQQSRELPREVTIFPEDELVTECTYNTLNRTQPTQGGYSMKQEMCLAYITYYPRVSLTNCQSMNPIQFFFFAFGIKKFYHYDMDTIEKIFSKLTEKDTKKNSKFINVYEEEMNEAHISTMMSQIKDYSIEQSEESTLFQNLVILEPLEFQNKTFSQHLLDLPWKEIYRSVEELFYYGRHKTFCRLKDDSLAMPASEHPFPNVTLYKVPNEENLHACKANTKNNRSTNDSPRHTKNIIVVLLFLIFLHVLS